MNLPLPEEQKQVLEGLLAQLDDLEEELVEETKDAPQEMRNAIAAELRERALSLVASMPLKFSSEIHEGIHTALSEVMAAAVEAEDITEEIKNALGGWLIKVKPATLRDWLKDGGWDKVTKIMPGITAELNALLEITKTDTLGRGKRTGSHNPATTQKINFESGPLLIESVMDALMAARPGAETLQKIEEIEYLLHLKRCFFGGYTIEKQERTNPRWLKLVVYVWMMEAAEVETHRLETYARALPFGLKEKGRTSFGDLWTPLPRDLEGVAAMGGPIEIDGEIYAQNPSFAPKACAGLEPRNMDLVPKEWMKREKQLSLGLDMADARAWLRPEHGIDEEKKKQHLEEWMAASAAKTAVLAQLPNMCPKLLGLMFATAPMTGRLVMGTLLELTKMLHPDWKNRRQTKRDLEAVGAAFVALKGLRLIETKPNGVQHPFELFVMDYDLSCKPDAQVGFTLNPFLAERMKGKGGGGGGYFLLNMTRWLAMGTQSPRLFPMALRLAAEWDRARVGGIYKPERLQWIGADHLAIETNTLPEGAALYRAGKTASKTAYRALKEARANLEDDLDKLKDAGLLGNWEKRPVHGEGFILLPVPPDGYDEACKGAVRAVREHRKRKR